MSRKTCTSESDEKSCDDSDSDFPPQKVASAQERVNKVIQRQTFTCTKLADRSRKCNQSYDAETKVRLLTREVGRNQEALRKESKTRERAVDKAAALEEELEAAKREIAELKFSNKELVSELSSAREKASSAAVRNREAISDLKAGLVAVEEEIANRAETSRSVLHQVFSNVQALQASLAGPSGRARGPSASPPPGSAGGKLAPEVQSLFRDMTQGLETLSQVLQSNARAGLREGRASPPPPLAPPTPWAGPPPPPVPVVVVNTVGGEGTRAVDAGAGPSHVTSQTAALQTATTQALMEQVEVLKAERAMLVEEVQALQVNAQQSMERASGAEHTSALIPQYRALIIKARSACTTMRERLAEGQAERRALREQAEGLQRALREKDEHFLQQTRHLRRQHAQAVQHSSGHSSARTALEQELLAVRRICAERDQQLSTMQSRQQELVVRSRELEETVRDQKAIIAELRSTMGAQQSDIRTALEMVVHHKTAATSASSPPMSPRGQAADISSDVVAGPSSLFGAVEVDLPVPGTRDRRRGSEETTTPIALDQLLAGTLPPHQLPTPSTISTSFGTLQVGGSGKDVKALEDDMAILDTEISHLESSLLAASTRVGGNITRHVA